MGRKTGFLVNPIAGMGGRVGLKGSDGVVDKAIALGAHPIAGDRAADMLQALINQPQFDSQGIEWLTCAGEMGETWLRHAGFSNLRVVYTPENQTDQIDTRKGSLAMSNKGAEIIVFCGGDGTARDVVSAVGTSVPVLGIPSGVKMYSGVFGSSPKRCAEILVSFLNHNLSIAEAEVVDLDEDAYRKGHWRVRLCHTAKVPAESVYVQSSKAMLASADEDDMKYALAEEVASIIRKQDAILFLLGPGSTLQAVGKSLGIEKTLLGIDAILNAKLVARDLNERQILALLNNARPCKLIVSPIGAQGFVLGRGNLQLSPAVLRKIGIDNLLVIATPGKLSRTPRLRFDTGDPELDMQLCNEGFIAVQVATGQRRLVPAIA